MGEIVIPKELLNGNFTFYLNDDEFFPKIQSNEKINFITLEFSGSGTNVVKIIATEYLNGSIEIISDDVESPIESPSSFDDYFILLIVGGIVVVVIILVAVKILKNKT